MEFIFDDSFRFLSNVEQSSNDINISFGNVILEKSIKTAQNTAFLNQKWQDYIAGNSDERLKVINEVMTGPLTDTEKQEFIKRVENLRKPSSGMGGNVENPAQQIAQEANLVGEAGSKASTIMETKEQVLARLRPYMSDKEINDILVLFMEKISLPYGETVKRLEYAIKKAQEARVAPKKVIEFLAAHYGEKVQMGSTTAIIDQATELQKLNPTVDVFGILKDSSLGNQPDISQIILMKDPDSRLVMNNLISLSQSNIPEQSEQIRRQFQKSKDILDNYTQKVNLQKAIVDMMQTEEMNLAVSRYISYGSDIFKYLMTSPLFRAIRSMYYDIQAAKITLNQLSSFVVDTTPTNPRISPYQSQESPGSQLYTPPAGNQRFNQITDELRFIKIAEDQKKTIIAQTSSVISNPSFTPTQTPGNAPQPLAGTGFQPMPQTGQFGYGSTGGFPTPEAKKQAENVLTQNFNKALDDLKKMFGKNDILDQVLEFFRDGLLKIIQGISSGTQDIMKLVSGILEDVIQKIQNFNWDSLFDNVVNKIQSVTTNPYKTSEDPDTTNRINSSNSFVKIGQYSPQTQADTTTGLRYGLVLDVVAIITTSLALFSGGTGKAILDTLKAGKAFDVIITGVIMIISFIKNYVQQICVQFGWGYNKRAPASSLYFDKDGKLTDDGKQRLINAKNTRISLGFSIQEDNALAKATLQRSLNKTAVQTKLDALTKQMNQNVFLGDKTDSTPNMLPEQLQTKVKEFVDFVRQVEKSTRAELRIAETAIARGMSKYDPNQKIQAQNVLAEIKSDLIYFQSLISEYSSSALIMANLQRKRKLLQKLGPIQKRVALLQKMGISGAALITSPEGLLQQVSRIRQEEAEALSKLRAEYQKKIDLLRNPDKAQSQFNIPTETGTTKIPSPPLPPTQPVPGV
jgi:hypothetical protein